MINWILPFFREIFGSSLFKYYGYPTLVVALFVAFFQLLYSIFDRRCE